VQKIVQGKADQMQKLSNLMKVSFFGNIVTLFGGSIVSQMVAVVALPILTRLYTPENFGDLSIFNSYMGIISVFATLRYDTAILISENKNEALALLTISIFNAIGVGVLVTILLYAVNNFFIVMPGYLWPFLLFGVISSGIYQAYTGWSIYNKLFFEVARSKIYQAILGITVQILCSIIGLSGAGLISGLIVSQSVGVTILSKDARFFEIFPIRIPKLLVTYKKYFQFALFSTPATLFNSINPYLPVFFLLAFYNKELSGQFFLAQQVVGIPISNLKRSIAQVFLSKTSVAYQENRFTYLYQISIRFIKSMIIPLTVIALTIFAVPMDIFGNMFGKNWLIGGQFIKILCCLYFSELISFPISQLIIIFHRQQIQLIWEFFRLISLALGCYVAAVNKISVFEIVSIYSIISIFFHISLTFISINLIRQRLL
jgi:O-antigen/teichoic acid export membrane protein